MQWYTVHVYSGYEKKAMVALKEHIALKKMSQHFGAIELPTEEVIEMHGGKKRKSSRFFFPGYLLVQMNLTDETWHLVKSTPRIMDFVGGKQPVAVSEEEVKNILARVRETSDVPVPKTVLKVGELVRIVEEPFNDFEGTIEEVDYSKNKLRVNVVIFGRSTPVDLGFHQVVKQ